jgi:hypothetical protein
MRERFVAKLARGGKAIAIGRVMTSGDVSTIELRIGDRVMGTAQIDPGPWTEIVVAIPAEAITGETTTIDVGATGSAYASFHWWFAAAPDPR